MMDNNMIEQLEEIIQKKPRVPSYYLCPKAAEIMMKKAAGINQTI